MPMLQHAMEDLLHLFFPHICAGCGSDSLGPRAVICIRCLQRLPSTNFHRYADNPVEKIFRGRLPLSAAYSYLYFSKQSLVQRLLHQLKYRGNRELGFLLGNMMGSVLRSSAPYNTTDLLVPMPLHSLRLKKRGYNQAAILCDGLAAAMQIPVCTHAVAKTEHTETQTHKNRLSRWQNIEGRFRLTDAASLQNKHVLLVDDVVTTGATLEACGQEILKGSPASLSIATLAYAVK